MYKFIGAKFIGAMRADLAKTTHPEYGNQLWSKCTVRKSWTCVVSKELIKKGYVAFRPITNGYNRMHRISLTGMAILLKRHELGY